MPVPKRKRSRSRNRIAHANKQLKGKDKVFTLCHNCQAPIETHVACHNCGFYKGVKIFDTKMDRALKRGLAKKAAQPVAQDPQAPQPA
ncbi:MAG: 50S ribosomal protein L32 [Candidatus Babeliales bacterium]|nr:50S ribosomal protein L32 [Candidatus Babeliales bacterium]